MGCGEGASSALRGSEQAALAGGILTLPPTKLPSSGCSYTHRGGEASIARGARSSRIATATETAHARYKVCSAPHARTLRRPVQRTMSRRRDETAVLSVYAPTRQGPL